MPKSISKSRKKTKQYATPEHTRRKLSRKAKKYWARVKQIATRSKVPIREARRRYSASVVELTVRTPTREVRQRFIETTPPGTPQEKRKYAEIKPGQPRKLAFAGKKRFTKKYVDRIIKTQKYVAGVRRISDLTGMSYRDAQTFAAKTGAWRYEKYMSGKALLQFAAKYSGRQPRSSSKRRKSAKRR